ncbi:hypothetical protein BV898_14751 [Hypsibius exemplaris]|uniref:EGF-like domain-containing protein n=1 Tax=Hypsibius exemplaris TaxID=2072580 RepID=A0A9X6NCR1_HYPEX|nr:hypothetical protein BV898_14751 [Hypsibius exemplaris]
MDPFSRFAGRVLGLGLLLNIAVAHVRLQYPVARNYATDALGNKWTVGLCGMPRDAHLTTDLQAGSTFNVTWHLGAWHEGGLRVELLDTNYNLIKLLVPAGGDLNDTSPAHFTAKDGVSGTWFGDDPAPTRQEVTLPAGITCNNCVIRLVKLAQTLDPTDPGSMYYFNSCSDVNVLNETDVVSKCSGRGTWRGSSCQCQKPFVGDVCQYADECADNADCGPHGSCIDTQAQAYPKKQCYCQFGWHGQACALESSVKVPDFKAELYKNRTGKFGGFTFYWRILEDIAEIEVVVVAKAKNWVAVGWRPSGSNTSCKAFPDVKPDTTVTMTTDGKSVKTVLDFMDRNSSFFTGSLHPMACTDITYIATHGNLSRFLDTYTRDHSTPLQDSVYGGSDGLTAAVAYEDPTTNIITALYRRKLIASDPSDVSVLNGPMHVIWSMGADPFDPSGVSAATGNNATAPLTHDEILRQFPRKGDFNSHNHNPRSRGVWEVNLRTGETWTPKEVFVSTYKDPTKGKMPETKADPFSALSSSVQATSALQT